IQLSTVGTAWASPNGFHIHAGPDQFAVNGGIDETSSSALSDSGVMTGLQGAIGTASFSAAAGPGIARASINATFNTQPGFAFNANVQAAATSGLLISGPDGVVPVNTSINLHIDGTITPGTCSAPAVCDIA